LKSFGINIIYIIMNSIFKSCYYLFGSSTINHFHRRYL